MKIILDKALMVKIGTAGLKVGKAIVIEGTKAVIAKGTTRLIMEGIDNGVDGIKNISLDEVLGKNTEEEPERIKKGKRGFFKRKKKDDTEDIPVDIITNSEGELVAILPKGAVDNKLKGVSEEV